MRFAYSIHVKLLSLMLVLIIGLMTLAPAPSAYLRSGQTLLSIQALDVCSSSAAGIDRNLPYFIHECPCSPFPPLRVGVRTIPTPLFDPLLIPFRDERPPRA